jgi:hypothetical protein
MKNLPQQPMLREPNCDDQQPRAHCDFFEGVVMKRADSIYPVQLRSTTQDARAG